MMLVNFWSLDLNVKIGKRVTTKTNSCRYLGVTIARNLKWSEHIDITKTKLQEKIGISYKTRQFISKKALYLIFTSFFKSNIRYYRGWANEKCINDVNVLIKREFRWIH